MSSLTSADKHYLEKILDMVGGYVLEFDNGKFEELFKRHGLDIHGHKYRTYGTSKAKKLRAFWESESDELVGAVLSETLDVYEAVCESSGRELNTSLLAKSRQIVARLSRPSRCGTTSTVENLLNEDFKVPNVHLLPVTPAVAEIIEDRLKEAHEALAVRAHLSVIFLCGSVLEGVLLGAAQRDPERFNRSPASPKSRDRKVKQFPEWSLAEFIDVASDIGLLKPDVQRFSHGLRVFRNYIHPYEQVVSNFKPDEHTAKLCFQVLKAALADVAGDR